LLSCNRFSTGIGEPASHLRGLRVSKAKAALVLLFHQLDYVCDIFLSLRWLCEHAIENVLHLIFGHVAHYSTPASFAPDQVQTMRAVGKTDIVRTTK